MLIVVTVMTKFLHISNQSVLLCASESVLGVRSTPVPAAVVNSRRSRGTRPVCKAVQGYGRFSAWVSKEYQAW
jgi:hypothetical protein